MKPPRTPLNMTTAEKGKPSHRIYAITLALMEANLKRDEAYLKRTAHERQYD